jgi:transcriptional regulator with XRE-family HTH domain
VRGTVAEEQPALSFAGLVRQLRAGAGLTQEELAGSAGLPVRTLSDLERGGRAAELAAARNRLELMATENLPVSAAFNLSYAELTSDQQRLFRRLGTAAAKNRALAWPLSPDQMDQRLADDSAAVHRQRGHAVETGMRRRRW